MTIADKTTRFLNCIIDTVIYILIIMLHVFVSVGLLHFIPRETSFIDVYFILLYFAYYFLFEYFIGRTPGKLITKTKVTNVNGDKPKTEELFIRNICRFIPFDNLSFLFSKTGWHDNISDTRVIYIR